MSDHAFICYARDDQEFVLEFAKNLRERGASIWIDQFDIPVSTDWDTAIDDALYECSTFIIVLSPQSVKSKEVRAELRTALDEDIKILPVIYQECRLPRQLRLVQYVDFTGCSPSDDEKLGLVLSALGVEEAQEDETPVQTDEHDKKGASLSNNHPNREIYNALTRIYGITLGETTEDEFCDVVEGIDGEFEHDYTIGDETTYKGSGTQLGADISFKNKIAFKWRISFGSWNWDMPKSLADLGFTWDLSYRSWISLLERLEFDVEVVKKPKRQEVKKNLLEGNWAKIETAFGLRETYRKFEATLRAQIPGIDTLEMILHFSREKEDFINERTPRTLYDIEIKLLDAE